MTKTEIVAVIELVEAARNCNAKVKLKDICADIYDDLDGDYNMTTVGGALCRKLGWENNLMHGMLMGDLCNLTQDVMATLDGDNR